MPKVKDLQRKRSSTRKNIQRLDDSRASSERQHFILGALAIAAAVLLVYVRVFRAGFIWDDDAMLTDNRLIRSPDGLLRFWFSTEPPDYFPLVSSLLWLQWRLWGLNAAGYHVVQVLLHAINSILLWRVGRKMGIPGAWWAGMLFGLHPVNVESVAWITETKNTLPVAFCLGSLLVFLHSEERRSRGLCWVSVGLFTLALLGKTSVAPFPMVLLVIAWWRQGRIEKPDVIKSLPFFAASFILGLVTVWFQSHRAIMHTVIREDGFLSRFAVAGWAVWFYLYKAILPARLSFVYPRWNVNPQNVVVYLPAMLLAAAAAALYLLRASIGRAPFAALLSYILFLAPVLGFVNIYFMRYSFVADHWQYVALTVFCLFAAGVIAHYVRQLGVHPRRNAAAAAGIAMLLVGFLTWKQTAIYRNNETLFTDVLARNPNAWIAHNNLGIIMAQRGELDRALDHYDKALKQKPDLADAYLNIGNVQKVKEDYAAAEKSFLKSLQLQPNFRTHNALGEVYLAQKKPADAVAQFQHALEKAPDFYLVHRNLGDAYLEQAQFDAAVTSYQNAVKYRPRDPENHNRLALALMKAGRRDEAIAQLRKMTEMFPTYAPAFQNLNALLKAQE